MKSNIRRVVASLSILCLSSLAWAELPATTAETLMRKSGAWAQLGDVANQVKMGMAQSAPVGALPPDEAKRLDQVADAAFAANRLRDSVQEVLARDLTVAQSVDALRWYDSPAGRQITAMEEAFSTNFDDMSRVMAEGNQALAKASTKRQSLLSQVVKAAGTAEALAAMQINSTVAVMQGLAGAMLQSTMPSAAELRKSLESQRPQMVAAAVGVALSMSALTYQSASDQVLSQYVKFLSSKSGLALTKAMAEGLDTSLSQAAKRLGTGIPPAPGGTATL